MPLGWNKLHGTLARTIEIRVTRLHLDGHDPARGEPFGVDIFELTVDTDIMERSLTPDDLRVVCDSGNCQDTLLPLDEDAPLDLGQPRHDDASCLSGQRSSIARSSRLPY